MVAEAAAAAEELETGKPKWHALLELLRIPDDKASLRLLEGQGDVHRSESAPLYGVVALLHETREGALTLVQQAVKWARSII